jgi:hypothetical protein
MNKSPADMVRVVVVVGTKWTRADVAISRTAVHLDNFEQLAAASVKEFTGNTSSDLTNAVSQIMVASARQGVDSAGGMVILAGLWLAIRGRNAAVSLDDLVARARRSCLTIKTEKGSAWEFRVSDMDEIEACETAIALH